MTRATYSIVFGLLAAGCGSGGPRARDATDIDTERDSVARVLDGMHDAAAGAREADYFAYFADDAVFLGTDATERWNRAEFRAYAHPFFERGRAWTFHATRRAISFDETGSLAWFDEDLETEDLGPARGSGVLRREGLLWKIVHYNLTVTVPNDRFADVRAVLSGADVIPVAHQTVDLCTVGGHHGYEALQASLRQSCGERSIRCEVRFDGRDIDLELTLHEAGPATCETPGPAIAVCHLPAASELNPRAGAYPNAVSRLPRNSDVQVRVGGAVAFVLRTDRQGNVVPGWCFEPFAASALLRSEAQSH